MFGFLLKINLSLMKCCLIFFTSMHWFHWFGMCVLSDIMEYNAQRNVDVTIVTPWPGNAQRRQIHVDQVIWNISWSLMLKIICILLQLCCKVILINFQRLWWIKAYVIVKINVSRYNFNKRKEIIETTRILSFLIDGF